MCMVCIQWTKLVCIIVIVQYTFVLTCVLTYAIECIQIAYTCDEYVIVYGTCMYVCTYSCFVCVYNIVSCLECEVRLN